jgi:hypothetical protein
MPSFGVTISPAQDQQLVAQKQVVQQRVMAKFQSGQDQMYSDKHPTDHAAEDSEK